MNKVSRISTSRNNTLPDTLLPRVNHVSFNRPIHHYARNMRVSYDLKLIRERRGGRRKLRKFKPAELKVIKPNRVDYRRSSKFVTIPNGNPVTFPRKFVADLYHHGVSSLVVRRFTKVAPTACFHNIRPKRLKRGGGDDGQPERERKSRLHFYQGCL